MQTAARFTEGSTLRHVLIMSGSGTVGLLSIFLVDLLNLYYVGLLGEAALTAAVGYASTLLFFLTSFSIGVMISVSALVSRALGARDRARAASLASSGAFWAFFLTALVTLISYPFADELLELLGARGETLRHAERFLLIALPSAPFMALGMVMSAVLRAVGDARRAMQVTLFSGLATAVLDPLLMFGFGLGLDGAALSTILSRLIMFGLGLHGVLFFHRLLGAVRWISLKQDFNALFAVAGPAVLTNLATPVAAAFMTVILSPFGEAAIAANAIISRLVPVAFGATFALSGAIGPILGQNLGAGLFERVNRAFLESAAVTLFYCVLVWGLLALFHGPLAHLFGAAEETAALVHFFCVFVAWSWLFHGLVFIGNAAFNNLGYPLYATLFNWGKATLGTVPFAYAGAAWAGASGALMGQGLGALVFGLLSLIAVRRVLKDLQAKTQSPS